MCEAAGIEPGQWETKSELIRRIAVRPYTPILAYSFGLPSLKSESELEYRSDLLLNGSRKVRDLNTS